MIGCLELCHCFGAVPAVAEIFPDTETPTEVETVGDKELLFNFSSAVQGVNVPVAKINVSIIVIFFFILSPSFQQQVYPKKFKYPEFFGIYKLNLFIFLYQELLILSQIYPPTCPHHLNTESDTEMTFLIHHASLYF